jgi:hypothetical protein
MRTHNHEIPEHKAILDQWAAQRRSPLTTVGDKDRYGAMGMCEANGI